MTHNRYNESMALKSAITNDSTLLDSIASMHAELVTKLKQQQSQVSQDLLTLLLPHVTQALPASTVVEVKPTSHQTRSKHTITKGMHFKTDGLQPYVFTSCFEAEVLPLCVRDVRYQEVAAGSEVTMTIAALPGTTLLSLQLDSLIMYLHGESHLIDALHVHLLQDIETVSLCLEKDTYSLELIQGAYISPVQGLLPTSQTAEPALQYLLEHLCYDERQHFIRFVGLEPVNRTRAASEFTLTVQFDKSIPALNHVSCDNIRLNCFPMINLYPSTCEPLTVTAQQQDYPITVDINDSQCWLHDIVDVTLQDRYGNQQRLVPAHEQSIGVTYKQKQLLSKDSYPHYSLSLQNNYDIAPQTATIAARVHQGNGPYDALYPGVALTVRHALPDDLQARVLTRPQRVSRAWLDGAAIDTLNIFLQQHFQSISDCERLKQLLTIFDVNQRYQPIITNITAISATPLAYCHRGTLYRGFTIRMTVSKAVNNILSLRKLGSILHRFFCYYADLNTVVALVIYSQHSDEEYTWQPLLGQKISL